MTKTYFDMLLAEFINSKDAAISKIAKDCLDEANANPNKLEATRQVETLVMFLRESGK